MANVSDGQNLHVMFTVLLQRPYAYCVCYVHDGSSKALMQVIRLAL